MIRKGISRMSNRKFLFILIIITITMFGLFKNRFAMNDDSALIIAIQKGAFLVDVRTPGEFASGSVKGAINIPLDQIPLKLSQFKGKGDIVVFCRSGSRSNQAKTFLDKSGISNVFDGGTWQDVQSMLK
jgi:rhodanese-related sulfurtransferase